MKTIVTKKRDSKDLKHHPRALIQLNKIKIRPKPVEKVVYT